MLGSRVAALAVLLAVTAACGREGAPDPHAAIACAGCHRGEAVEAGRATLTEASCVRGGCHEDGGPDSVRVAMVTFAHRRHASGDSTRPHVQCYTCHTHRPGSSEMTADPARCSQCHYRDLTDVREPGCVRCHPTPRHARTTSQGVAIAHADLEAARVPCTRCHYQLVDGRITIDSTRCLDCHRDTTVMGIERRARRPAPGRGVPAAAQRATERAGLVRDSLHAGHTGYGCGACHEPVHHRVAAMSTTVDLVCTDCHAPRHRRPIPEDTVPGVRCDDCHEGVHAEEQRLILGLLPDEPIRPSPMFMGGVTCRSCHVALGQPAPQPGRPLQPDEASCIGCHGLQWRGYLALWRRGYGRRDALVAGYVRSASAAVGDSAAPAAARGQVRRAASLLDFVRAAGPLHNLPASDRIMRDALRLAQQAYRTAGREPPTAPELGPQVLVGTCMSCHYGVEELRGEAGPDGRRLSHADHLFRARLPCETCHAAGAAPPGISDSTWIDTTRAPQRQPR